mmetsp:Transcript_82818/g.146338  ORF Transcript_82818/g.146338 Transcript_82818/m.146338 type:complete len:733 (-) Transcript_82818:257-2455(-)|eukprot:CAMPEP_0197632630 /NCGR_PEP_ID=MMETSP1338-20131121/9283_1 /TAXON_ID=43686 ORGANISM="Pelagodinium beii, Strain RCC1491" /NCGR_SAMPLE_ID=MMETSP1338 /ASSEMBLY_ACC=CAM_ASM_000754 /LENGTH=732 /DNA_ID=CAMNT_0043204193 /DNA_START=39 /DNA_END=2237 /DNA_ORIENTATION=+
MNRAALLTACLLGLAWCVHAGSQCGRGNLLLQLGRKQSSIAASTVGHSWVVQVGTGQNMGRSRGGINGTDHALQRYFCPLSSLDDCQPDPKHGISLPEDALRPCTGVVSEPIAQVAAGSELFVSWMGNGHVNNGQSNGSCVRLLLADFALDPDFSDFAILPGGDCISYWHWGHDGRPETSTRIEIPADTRLGTHTLLWYWNFTDFWYSSCADIEVILADSSTSQPLLEQQIQVYLQNGCSSTDSASSTSSAANDFCASYIGPGSYCKSWQSDECGRSACHQGDFLLPCGSMPVPLPSPSPVPSPGQPACGNELCNSRQPGSWCRGNGVCQWIDEPCACESPTPSSPAASTTTTTMTVTTAASTSITTVAATITTSNSRLCGDELCRSLNSASWCRSSNGVCQWTDVPCECEANEVSTTSSTRAVQSTTFPVSDEDRYTAIEKTIYVWNTGDLDLPWWDWGAPQIELLISVCQVHGFKRAIVFIGSLQWDWEQFQAKKIPHEEKFRGLFAALRQSGISPHASFYLNDSPNDLTGWERAVDVVSALYNFNKAYPASAVVGIDGDQEPTSVSEEYLSMNTAMMEKRDELHADFEIAAALKPGWLFRDYAGSPMAVAALEGLDAGMIMAYSQSLETSRSWGNAALAFGEARGRAVFVAIETSPRAPETDSLWQIARSEPGQFLQSLVDMDVDYAAAHPESYRGLVVHDYEGFFEAMYGVKATAFTANVVSKLYQED